MISLATRPIMQNLVIVRYIYPALSSPPPALQFDDQFAFRPTGSTTAAIVHLLDSVIKLLDTEPYAIVISLDFSKAFDTYGTRHYSVNWLNFIFLIKYTTGSWTSLTINRIPRTSLLHINASIIQGSAIGPAAYVVTAGDLVATVSDNSMCKYACLLYTSPSPRD